MKRVQPYISAVIVISRKQKKRLPWVTLAYVFDFFLGVQVDLQQLVDAFRHVERDHQRDGQRHEDPDGVLAFVAQALHEGLALGERSGPRG